MRRMMAALMLAAPGALMAQGTIDSVQVQPSPACVNEPVTATVAGTGVCQNVRINFDYPDGTPDPALMNPTFPVMFGHTYSAVGTYAIRAVSTDPNCPGEATATLSVEDCAPSGPVVPGEIIAAVTPKVTGGFGLVQPGNPYPVVVFGTRFGSSPGKIFLEGTFGVVELTLLEWGADGKFASGYIPDGICGAFDQEASIFVESAAGFRSNRWTVSFTARRELQLLPRADVTLLSCGDDSNRDCCNHECDPTDLDYYTICGFPTSSICAAHYNVWGAIGDDEGTDRYRVDLRLGAWVIDSWNFVANVDPGEGWASLNQPSAYREPLADFEVDWSVTPNDMVFYDVFVFIEGPCGTTHRQGVAQSALESARHLFELQAGVGEIDRNVWRSYLLARERIAEEARERARKADRRTRAGLASLREAVNGVAIDRAREIEALQREVRALIDGRREVPAGLRERLRGAASPRD